jgi:hypothetical protein
MRRRLKVVICPKCGTENLVDAMNCIECRVNLEWAQENFEEPGQEKTKWVEFEQEKVKWEDSCQSKFEFLIPFFLGIIFSVIGGLLKTYLALDFGPADWFLFLCPIILMIVTISSIIANIIMRAIGISRSVRYFIIAGLAFIIGFIPNYYTAF